MTENANLNMPPNNLNRPPSSEAEDAVDAEEAESGLEMLRQIKAMKRGERVEKPANDGIALLQQMKEIKREDEQKIAKIRDVISSTGEKSPSNEEIRFCSNCGAPKASKDSIFCIQCGSKLGGQ